MIEVDHATDARLASANTHAIQMGSAIGSDHQQIQILITYILMELMIISYTILPPIEVQMTEELFLHGYIMRYNSRSDFFRSMIGSHYYFRFYRHSDGTIQIYQKNGGSPNDSGYGDSTLWRSQWHSVAVTSDGTAYILYG